MLSGLAILPLTAALALGGNSELRSRLPGDVGADGEPARTSLDSSTALSAQVTTEARPYALRLSYSPLFGVAAFNQTDTRRLELSHTGGVLGAYEGARTSTSLQLQGSGGYRRFSSLVGPSTAQASAQVLPNVTVGFLRFQGSVQETLRLTQRHILSSTAGYSYSRALDAESAQLIPVSHGPQLQLGYRYALSALTQVGLDLSGTRIKTEPPARAVAFGADAWTAVTLLNAALVWSQQLSEPSEGPFGESAQLTLRAGVSVSREESPDGARWNKPVPLAGGDLGGALSHSFVLGRWGVVQATANVSLSNVIDQQTGLSDQRLNGLGRLTWVKRTLQVFAGGGGTHSLNPPEGIGATTVYGEVGSQYSLSEEWFLTGGGRVSKIVSSDLSSEATESMSDDSDRLLGNASQDVQWAAFFSVGFNLEPFPL